MFRGICALALVALALACGGTTDVGALIPDIDAGDAARSGFDASGVGTPGGDASVDASGDASGADGPPGIPTGAADAAALEASVLDDASNACGPGGSGLLLECASRCPSDLFSYVALADDFGAATTYAQDWNGTYVAPTLTAQGLQFGPHPMSTNWWETYSPTQTNATTFGNVLLCVRFRLNVAATVQGDNSFQVSIRGGSEGMVFGYMEKDQLLSLSTKVDANDTWVQHAAAVVPLALGDGDVEMALYGHDNDFYAQMKEVATGRVYALRASYSLPANGFVSMLGWQLSQALIVSRIAIGTPTDDAASRMLPSQG